MATKPKKTGSIKHNLIDKANKRIVILTSVAGFIVVFTIVAANTLVGQIAYQDKVIGTRKDALQVAQTNLTNVEQLISQYNAFNGTSQNIIGGDTATIGDGNGDNAQIIINALPSRYDFPALTASLEYLAQKNGLKLTGITATDDEITQQLNTSSSAPAPIEIPFVLAAEGSHEAVQALIKDFQASIRPFQVRALQMTAAEDGKVSATITAVTFFQPAKNLNVREEPVQ